MKATDLLKQQHKEVKALFKRLEDGDGASGKRDVFEKIAANLVAHDAIERTIFYPACEEAMGMTDLLGESLVEHGVIEFSLYLADQARADDDFEAKCTVLREMLEHHIEEEEDDFFPKVEKALSNDKLDKLGGEMKALFTGTVASDFRVPLHNNLKQVLAGATKTKRAPAKEKTPVSKTVVKAAQKRATSAKGHNGKRAASYRHA